ncbi:MAG: hypothetical protein AAF317_00915 [Pseudomonadota bacterium]
MSNPFSLRATSLNGPGIDYAPVTPSDSQPLLDVAVSLYVENGGAIVFVSEKGQNRTVRVPDNGWILCGVRHIRATGTTATGIHAIVVN